MASKSVAVIPAAMLEKIRADPMLVFPDANTVVLSSNELGRMKSSSVVLTKEDVEQQRLAADKSRRERQAKAVARKERMLELERARKKKAPAMSEMELEAMREREAILEKASASVDEQHEDVKRMSQMVLYAKCVAIRDKQIAEKQAMKELEKQQEVMLDRMMEYERQQTIRRLRSRDKDRHAEQKKGASVIIKQMALREKARLREQELKMQEGVAMLKQAQEREVQDEKNRLKKIEKGKKLLDEIVKANQDQAREKARRKQKEIEEDLKIAKYIQEKEAREAEYEAQQDAIQAHKDNERKKLREAREKDNDHQAEIDALRARRAHEERERRWRESQRAAARKQAKIQAELAAAREFQRMEKERKMSEQAQEEKMQFERMLKAMKEQEANDAKKEEQEREKRAYYSKVLKEQIREIEARRKDRAKVIDMGEQTRTNELKELRYLEKVKANKLAELQKCGVPAKYTAELARFKLMQPKSFS